MAQPATGAQPAAGAGTQAVPTTGTQAIPTTGTQQAARAAGARTASSPAGPARGSSSSAPSAPSAPAASAPAAPPVPPAGAPTGPATGAQRAPGVPPVQPAGAGAPGATGTSTTGPAKGKTGRTTARGPRRARLQLRHIDTWSALKISLVLSIALFFIWMVAVGVLYGVLNALGVFDTLNELFGQLGTDSGSEGSSEVLTPGVVFGGAAVIGAINVVLLTALCTVGTFIYNMCSDLVGGLELTLSERD
ncbi:DUF3566 domain-containing protein [Blastococcus sp. TML/C7B]|nr:DUF3566 domain-containing protein [Blastococcus sp. TML/C7B]